jgi:hypothetical protein
MFKLNPFRETPYNLQFVFVGKMYQWQYNTGFVNGVSNIQIRTSTDQIMHLIARNIRTASTGMMIKLIESPTITSTGTIDLSVHSVNRVDPVPATAIFASSVSATVGSTIENINLVSGITWEQSTPELVLKLGTDYNIRITNSGTSVTPVDFNFVWYESNN